MSDNLAIGARLQYTTAVAENIKRRYYGVRYFRVLLPNWSLALGKLKVALGEEANIGFSFSVAQYPKNANKPKSVSAFGIGVAPGVGLYPSKWGIEFTLPSIELTSSLQSGEASIQLRVQTLSPAITLCVLLKI
ncbi:MAG: hypothetical protein NZM38_05205 [Cytophagales bacterium]|nr:hypothetical protein [Cytophagales bacterium]MDW8384151.1 hypothetical protein [Flammeovirgaceae bacterium]